MVEGTAGNTGIGLAHMCNALGYKCVIFMPNTQSQVRLAKLCMLVILLGITSVSVNYESDDCTLLYHFSLIKRNP